jgi:hypothetical protein
MIPPLQIQTAPVFAAQVVAVLEAAQAVLPLPEPLVSVAAGRGSMMLQASRGAGRRTRRKSLARPRGPLCGIMIGVKGYMQVLQESALRAAHPVRLDNGTRSGSGTLGNAQPPERRMGVVVVYGCDSWQHTADAAHAEPRSS